MKNELTTQETQAMIRCADFILEMLQKYAPEIAAGHGEEKAS